MPTSYRLRPGSSGSDEVSTEVAAGCAQAWAATSGGPRRFALHGGPGSIVRPGSRLCLAVPSRISIRSPRSAPDRRPVRRPRRVTFLIGCRSAWSGAPRQAANPRERTNRLRLRTAATLAAVALSLVATAVVAISLATRGTKPEMHDATLSARTSRPAGVLQPAVGTLIGAVEVLEHRVAHFRVVDGDVPTHRHPRHRTPPAHLSRSRAVHAPSESASPPTEGATLPNSGSYRSSSSSPAYSSQPAAERGGDQRPRARAYSKRAAASWANGPRWGGRK